MKTWESGGIAPPFPTSIVDGGELSASRPGHLTPGETAMGTHCVCGWAGPTAGLDAVEKRKIYPPLESNPGHPASSPSLNSLHIKTNIKKHSTRIYLNYINSKGTIKTQEFYLL
jgi:hypothetical protein